MVLRAPDLLEELPRRDEFALVVPDLSVGVSIEERVVAVALSDQLGSAFAADSPVG